MSQHFLMSAAARSLSDERISQMADSEVEATFTKLRWAANGGKPFCPKCGCLIVYDCRRTNGTPRWRCKACRHSFSNTSGTIFASRKKPLRTYLKAILKFCNEVKGKSMLALCRELDVQYKTAFVMAHKFREAMASEVRVLRMGGEGVVAEIDGAYFGGYVKPANLKKDRIDRRLAENQSGKKKVVVAIRERQGRTTAQVFQSEAASQRYIRQKVATGTVLHADEAGGWNVLEAHYVVHTINHDQAYSFEGASTNGVESFFSRIRRAEQGHHHHIAGDYLVRFAQEAAWREDYRRHSNGEQVMAIAKLALAIPPSVDFSGYWQRTALARRVEA